MKQLLLFLLLPFAAFSQCDTVTLNSASPIGFTTATINATFPGGSATAYTLVYVRAGQTDTTYNTSGASSRNLTGLQQFTSYVYYWATNCGFTTVRQSGRYYFTTLGSPITYTPMTGAGYQFKYVKADTGFAVPFGDTTLGRGTQRPGSIKIGLDSIFYGYDGTIWQPLGGDITNILDSIGNKVDSVTVSGDTLKYWKQGVSYAELLATAFTFYNSNGTLSSDRTVTGDNKRLAFAGLNTFDLTTDDTLVLRSTNSDIVLRSGGDVIIPTNLSVTGSVTATGTPTGSITDSIVTISSSNVLQKISPSRINSLNTLATVTAAGNSTTDSIRVVSGSNNRVIIGNYNIGGADSSGFIQLGVTTGRVGFLNGNGSDTYTQEGGVFRKTVPTVSGSVVFTYPNISGTGVLSVNSQTANSAGNITLTAANVGALGTGDSATTALSNFTSIGRAYKIVDSLSNGMFWRLGGNSTTAGFGSRIGTTGNTSLRFVTNGALRMILDSTGKLGIGTTSPLSTVHVVGAKGTLNSNAAFNTLGINVDDSSTLAVGAGGGFTLRANEGSSQLAIAAIDAFKESASVSDFRGSLRFFTGSNATGYPNEVMRINSSGAIGVGTTTPIASAILDLSSTTRGFLLPRLSTVQRDAVAYVTAGLQIYNSTTNSVNTHNGANWTGGLVVDASATLTLEYGVDYVFSGTTTTWTLPAVSASRLGRGNMITIKNRGSGAITLNSNAGSTIYTTSAVGTLTINAGGAVTLMPDGTYFDVISSY